MPIQPARFESHRAFLLGGLRRFHSFADRATSIPQQWAEFNRWPELPGRIGDVAYGAMCGTDLEAQRFEYLAGVEVADLAALPEGTGKMRVPEAYYAVFHHAGHVDAIRETWGAIWQDWVPSAGLTLAHTPDFERYGPEFDPRTGEGGCEIWIPVQRPA